MTASLPCEDVARHPQFRALAGIAGIGVELRYATADNFVGRDLYGALDCAWLHCDAAAALERSVAWLAAHHPAMTLLVLDALRPQRVQQQLWDALQGTELLGYIAEPQRGSIHSFGMALDVTLCERDARELDMGTPFDDLSPHSQPVLEARWLADGSLLPAHVARRQILRDAMAHGGWHGIASEWWHFDCGDRNLVRQRYARVL